MILSSWRRLCMLALLMPVFQCFRAFSQTDTLKITISESEKIFLQNNLSLLAARYNIDANKALIRQAKFWDNPVISTDQNIYDSQGGYFKHDQTNGQVYVQAMQLIRTAGKRNKLAQLAEDNTTISTGQFDDLLRTLRYALITDLYEIEHQLKIRRVYDAEINELQTLVAGMDEQLKSGNISVKDNIRIKALLFGLQNELVNVDTQLMPLQSEVKLLLRKSDSSFILPVFNYYLPDLIKKEIPSKEELVQITEDNRPDIKISRLQLAYASHNLTYQKALSKPDISIGTEYDQRSSYAPNYVGLAISFPLNILNRNQGNIASAQFNIKQQQALYDGQLSKIENDISSAVAKIKFYQQVNNLQQLDFAQQYESVFQNMLKSYQQRQVSLLEFIDFADAYKDTRLKILEQHTNLIKALVELNYQTGKDVISLNK
jgi:cobalt-zinc-cadmium efflux system outer membrane protein